MGCKCGEHALCHASLVGLGHLAGQEFQHWRQFLGHLGRQQCSASEIVFQFLVLQCLHHLRGASWHGFPSLLQGVGHRCAPLLFGQRVVAGHDGEQSVGVVVNQRGKSLRELEGEGVAVASRRLLAVVVELEILVDNLFPRETQVAFRGRRGFR